MELSGRQTRPRVVVRRAAVEGRYDAAQTTDDNLRHWAAADSLSADAANSYGVRKRLRERARYETTNNSTLLGIVDTYTWDVVGQHGPRLQLLTPDVELNQEVEREWLRYGAKVGLGRKLRLLSRARVVDGEGFALFTTNERLKYPVKLDIRLLECDRFHSPRAMLDENNVDGVILDKDGNAIRYEVLDSHPEGVGYSAFQSYHEYDSRWVLHWFVPFRPEQHRGVPSILACLPLAAYQRRFTLAVLAAAETAADLSALLYTDAPPAGEAAEVEPMDTVEIERNVMVTVPAGWKMAQFQPQQPASTYREFKRENTTDMGRPLAMPRNIAAGDSSDYNFASGRLDHGTYFRGIGVVQADMGEQVLDPVLAEWLPEARAEFGWVLEDEPDHEWLWQQREPIDPREANAETERLASGATTHPAIYAARGQDWRAEFQKGAEALGVSLEEYQGLIRRKLFSGKGGEKRDEEGEAASEARWQRQVDRELNEVGHGRI